MCLGAGVPQVGSLTASLAVPGSFPLWFWGRKLFFSSFMLLLLLLINKWVDNVFFSKSNIYCSLKKEIIKPKKKKKTVMFVLDKLDSWLTFS